LVFNGYYYYGCNGAELRGEGLIYEAYYYVAFDPDLA